MARNDGRIEPGQRLSTAISARAWNRAQQAADVVLGAGTGTAAFEQFADLPPHNKILVLNNGYQSDAPRWAPVLVAPQLETRPVGDQTDDATKAATTQFQQMPVVWTTNRTSTSAASLVCVLLQPLKVDGVGWAAVSGLCPVKIRVTQDAGPYAKFVQLNSNYTYGEFVTDRFSGFRIYWIQQNVSVGSNAWALISLSSFQVQEVVYARATSTINQQTTASSAAAGQAQLLYVKQGVITDSQTTIDVQVNACGQIPSGRYLWLKNPASADLNDNNFMGWAVIAAQNVNYSINSTSFYAG